VPIFYDFLLYFTSFGEVFVLFASVFSIVAWLLKAAWSWVTAEPETYEKRSRQFQSRDLNHLKRAGQ
jgi:hypothetical protein